MCRNSAYPQWPAQAHFENLQYLGQEHSVHQLSLGQYHFVHQQWLDRGHSEYLQSKLGFNN